MIAFAMFSKADFQKGLDLVTSEGFPYSIFWLHKKGIAIKFLSTSSTLHNFTLFLR